MVRAVAMSAASALCLIWTAGCASDEAATPKPAAMAVNSANPAPASLPNPAALAANLPDTVDGEVRRAEKLRSDGNYDDAVRSLAQIMLVAPDNARVVGEYGKTLEQQGHSQEALAFLKRAIELQPNDWKVYSALGVAYDQLDDHVSARAAYEHALALRPLEPSVLNNYAVSRMLAGDYPSAQRLFAQASVEGATNPKLALNMEKLATLEPHAPIEAAPGAPAIEMAGPAVAVAKVADLKPVTVPAAPKTGAQAKATSNTRLATTAPKSLAPQVVMQRVPVDPLAGPVARSTSSINLATSAPKPLGPQVVMERVPVDPLAGPVKRAKHAPVTLAKAGAAAHQPAPKPAAPTPSLRTAADSN